MNSIWLISINWDWILAWHREKRNEAFIPCQWNKACLNFEIELCLMWCHIERRQWDHEIWWMQYRPWQVHPTCCLGVIPRVQTTSRLPGKVPLSGTFPGNPIVWTLARTSPGGPTKHVGSWEGMSDTWARNWYRTAVFIKCAHAWILVASVSLTHSRNQSALHCPRKVGVIV